MTVSHTVKVSYNYTHQPELGGGTLEGSMRKVGSWVQARGNIHGAGGRA